MVTLDKNTFTDKILNIRSYSKLFLRDSKIDFERLNALENDLQNIQKKNQIKTIIDQLDFSSSANAIAFVLYFSVINFNFQDSNYTYTYNKKIYKRSTALMYALFNSFSDFTNSDLILACSDDDWKKKLYISENNSLSLLNERINNIRKMAHYIIHNNIDFIDFFKTFTNFNDVYIFLINSTLYEDPLLKRIQMTIKWIYDIAKKDNIILDNINILTGLADYRVPQLLYNLKIIVLDQNELKIINNCDKLAFDHYLVMKLRYLTIAICDIISKDINCPAIEVDNTLWDLSQKMIKKNNMKVPPMNVITDMF